MNVQRITPRLLADRFGCSERYWERHRKAMVRAGLLNKIGRVYFGDLDAIERALVSGGAEIWQSA